MKNKLLPTMLLLLACNISMAQINTAVLKPVAIKNNKALILGTKRMTSFDPAKHSFKFANTFNGVDGSSRYGGLCGGMVYAALDYYYANMEIPQQRFAPSNRYPLQSYIYKRQAKSAQESNWDRWAELWFNPGGARTTEFFNWGIEMKNAGDRMNELKAMIDNGKPAPLGLYHSDEGPQYGYTKGGDHQVLAIGYDFGRYKGDKEANLEDFKIFISDPNYPGQIKTLVADANARCFHYTDGRKEAWVTYFVNAKYEPFPPIKLDDPSFGSIVYVKIKTGEDDLRGGNDNLAITITYADGSEQRFENVNKSGRWVSDYEEVVPLQLNRFIVNRTRLKSFKFEASLGGGFNGDNWDCANIIVTNSFETLKYINKEGTFDRNGRKLIKRFTGDDKTLKLDVPQ